MDCLFFFAFIYAIILVFNKYRKECFIIMSYNQRQYTRVRVPAEAVIRTDEVGFISGKLVDISIAGACVECERKYEVGQALSVYLDLAHIIPGANFLFPAVVVWNSETDGVFRHGLLLTYIEDNDLKKLERVVRVMGV